VSVGSDNFQTQLRADLAGVYEDSFDPLMDPEDRPALAELAGALEPDANGTDAVESLLVDSIETLSQATRLFKTGKAQVKAGLIELFGLGGEHGKALTERGKEAGPLLGYPNGYDGLRKAQRSNQKLIARLLDELTQCLMELAATRDFTYTGQYEPRLHGNATPLEEVDARLTHQSGRRGVQAALLSVSLLKDLYTICVEGLEQATEGKSTLVISSLARHALKVDDSEPAAPVIASLLTWVTNRMSKNDSWRKVGIEVLLGLTEASKHKPLAERCQEAEDWIGGIYDPDYLFPGWAVEILREMRDWLIVLAVETGYWTHDDRRELDSGLIRLWEKAS